MVFAAGVVAVGLLLLFKATTIADVIDTVVGARTIGMLLDSF